MIWFDPDDEVAIDSQRVVRGLDTLDSQRRPANVDHFASPDVGLRKQLSDGGCLRHVLFDGLLVNVCPGREPGVGFSNAIDRRFVFDQSIGGMP